MADPNLYGRFRNAIKDYYYAALKSKPCEKPYIEYHFGEPRSGKTTAGLLLAGGKDNPDCHYQEGPFEWLTDYGGQNILFLNEYRASTKESLCMLLSIMEGFPANIKIKGGFTPVRINKLIITCPNPPEALSCEFWGNSRDFHGEYATRDKYSADHELVAWENVSQVTERILESGGKIVGHARRPKRVNGIA